MADRTPFAGFTHLDPSDPLSADGFGLQDRNPRLFDYFMRLLFTSDRDGHAALAAPTLDPTATIDTGGTIPADLALTVGYTLVDADGGETVISPLVVVNTAASLLPADDSPVLVADTTAGTLLAGAYVYAVTLTDGNGGETVIGPPANVVIPSGSATNQITVSNLATLATDAGAAGWRLWRSIDGEEFHLMATGTNADDTVTDDGSLTADCGVNPPSTSGTTNATSQLTANVPAGQPADAVQYRLYVAVDGDFGSSSLLGTYPVAELAVDKVFADLTLLPGSPPEVSTAMPAIPGGGGGGGGGLFSLPADLTADFSAPAVANYQTSDSEQVMMLQDATDAEIVTLGYDGTGYPQWSDYIYSDNAGATEEKGLDYFALSPNPGMRDGEVTVRLQFGADPATMHGQVSVFIGFRRGMRTYAQLRFEAGLYRLSVGVEDQYVYQSQDEVGGADVTAFAPTVDTDYWLRVTRDGDTMGGAFFDADPAVGSPAPLAEVVPTAMSGFMHYWDWARRPNALPGFGFRVMDDPDGSSGVIRIFGMTQHAETGGEGGYEAWKFAPTPILDGGTSIYPARLNFENFDITDERPDKDYVTIRRPGLAYIGGNSWNYAGAADPPYWLTQNFVIDGPNMVARASAAGADMRAIYSVAASPWLPTWAWWTQKISAMFMGIAADDQFGVMVRAYDLDSYLLARVNNTTATPALELVDNDDGTETVVKSVPITQFIVPGLGAGPWTDELSEFVWVSLEITGQNYVAVAVWDTDPELETAAPLAHFGVKLPKVPYGDRYMAVPGGGGFGVNLLPDAGGANALRTANLTARGTADG